MQAELMWFIGVAVTVILTLGGAIIAAFQRLSVRITDGDSANRAEIDRIKENYVRRDDHAEGQRRLEENMTQLREELREDMSRYHGQVLDAIKRQ